MKASAQEGFDSLVLGWLRTKDSEAAEVASVESYGTDWDGDTEGGFYSTFEVTVNYLRSDGSKRTRWCRGDDMDELWHAVVGDYKDESMTKLIDYDAAMSYGLPRNRAERAILRASICECVLDCRDCSHSGREWHTHDGEDQCPVHPDALRVG